MHKHRERAAGGRKVKRALVVAFSVLFFFVLSNYYMGFFDAKPVTIKPGGPPNNPPLELSSDEPIIRPAGGGEDDHQHHHDGNNNDDDIINNDDNGAGNNNDDGGEEGGKGKNKKGEFNPPEVKEREWAKNEKECPHTRDRDYRKDPIIIAGRFSGTPECDVPCSANGVADASVGSRSHQCPHVKSIFFSMENSIPPPGSYDIVANTQLTSDVPLPYFSWAEYDFKAPVQKKTATAHVAAFISNCGPQKRLNWMEVMQRNGIKIDSFGSCLHNKEVPAEYSNKHGNQYNAIKQDIIGKYKFAMAFENSATDDYVTEKLFGVLVAGAVPLYDGASNGKKFGPSAKSMIFAQDFGTPEKLAEYLLYLDKNDTAYEEYLQWKKTGPSDEWVALVDLAKVHSDCRLCIRTADMNRKEVGPVHKGQPGDGEPKPSSGKYLELHVRERGKFWLRPIYLTAFSLSQLKEKITKYVPHEKGSYLFQIHELWSRKIIESDEDIASLSQQSELEAIFVVPQDWSDLNLMW